MTGEEKLELLNSLRERIPEMRCLPGCTSCCGHTAWSEFEWSQIPEETRAKFDQFSFKCSFCSEDGCKVHDYRPIICRMFGVAEGMPCQYGVGIGPDTIPKQEVDDIGKTYVKYFFKGDYQ